MDAEQFLIAGGSGSIGRLLTKTFQAMGVNVVWISRNPNPEQNSLHYSDFERKASQIFEKPTVLVNLAGAAIAEQRWSVARKGELTDSRVLTTKALVQAILSSSNKPILVIQGSATGIYGNMQYPADETEKPGRGFLSDLAIRWEAGAKPLQDAGIPVAIVRMGTFLDRDSGFLKALLPLFRLNLGSPIGSGRQYISWIHKEDVSGAFLHLVQKKLSGVFNVTAPNPVTNRDFSSALNRVLHRFNPVPIPGAILELLLGQMAKELILSGQQAIPRHLLTSGYEFRFSTIDQALENLIQK